MSVKKHIASIKNLLLITAVTGCIEKYETPPSKYDASYLVVDGFLNASTHSAEVKLTRTLSLSVNESLTIEKNAAVTIESERGDVYDFKEASAGNYQAGNIAIDPNSKYKLHIITIDGSEYQSDYVSVLSTPPLDSISWKPGADGVTIYANAHDPNNNTRYYKWNFTETWEYTTTYFSYFRRQGGEAIPRNPDEYIYKCWLTEYNTEILISSTARLISDRISEARLAFIPKGSLKLGRIYSMLVQQKAVTEEAYNYWLQLEKSTENLGGLFDPLPSQVLGNMHSEKDTAEPVLGFFSASTVEEKRIFIQFKDLPDDLLVVYQKNECERTTIPIEKLSTIGNKIILDPISPPGRPVNAYFITSFECGNCTSRGGVTIKPDYWIQ